MRSFNDWFRNGPGLEIVVACFLVLAASLFALALCSAADTDDDTPDVDLDTELRKLVEDEGRRQ
jgi:hypothetical protein